MPRMGAAVRAASGWHGHDSTAAAVVQQWRLPAEAASRTRAAVRRAPSHAAGDACSMRRNIFEGRQQPPFLHLTGGAWIWPMRCRLFCER